MVAGPSGVGKGTVVQRVLQRVPDLRLSVSATTRPPRVGERDGVDYRFLNEEAFERLARAGGFLEQAEVFGHRYGTPRRWVEERLEAGEDVILEIDVQGAEQVRGTIPEAVLVFLDAPSSEELERRLRSRGTEDEVSLSRRLATAERERGQRERFDHVVVNDDLERASAQVAAIIEWSQSPPEGSTHP